MMTGRILSFLHRLFYGLTRSFADACDPGETQAQEIERVTVKSYTRKRPYQDRREALHARLREEIGRAA